MRIAATAARPAQTTHEVQAQRTRASMSDIRTSLSRAVQSVTGRPASARTIDLLVAQASLETGQGSQMFNYNFGGIKGVSPSGTTANYMTREVLGGQSVHIQQGFRAYGSLDEGARDYVSVLQSRFPQAFGAAGTGSVDAFAHALKQSHYYTASETEYAAGLRAAVGASGSSAATGSAGAIGVSAPGDFGTTSELSRVIYAVASNAPRSAATDPQ